MIAKIAEPLGDLVTVGGEKTIGGGRVDNEQEWQSIVASLCQAASVVFMLPSSSGGITTEILMLRDQKYLWKTVLIMPPEIVEDTPAYRFVRWVAKKSPEYRLTADGRCHFLNAGIAEYWSAARTHLAERGIDLPPFQESGLAFALSDDGRQVAEICRLTSYLPVLPASHEWMVTQQAQAPPRMAGVLGKWGDSLWHDHRTAQIWPLLAYLLNLVDP